MGQKEQMRNLPRGYGYPYSTMENMSPTVINLKESEDLRDVVHRVVQALLKEMLLVFQLNQTIASLLRAQMRQLLREFARLPIP